MRATWMLNICGVTHSYVWHDSFIRVMWLNRRTCVWHDSFVCVTWLIHMWHDSFTCSHWSLIHTHPAYCAQMWMSHVTHMNELCKTYESVMSHIWKPHSHSFILIHHIVTQPIQSAKPHVIWFAPQQIFAVAQITLPVAFTLLWHKLHYPRLSCGANRMAHCIFAVAYTQCVMRCAPQESHR